MNAPDILTETRADGILLARIDMPGRAMNVFSPSLIEGLEALAKHVAADDAIRAVVLTSAKPAFLAGADLEMIRTFTESARTADVAQLNALFGRLGRLFRRIEFGAKPWVAAINGLALGGGLEVCLACHERVVADDPSIQLGLPEVKLGLLPGAGGTQRLPRLVGTAKGMRMLLTGESIAPQEALSLGLVQAVVPGDELIDAATERARALAARGAPKAPWDVPGARFDSAPYDFSDPAAARAAIVRDVGLTDGQVRHYPAYRAIVDCVVGGWPLPMTEGCEHEMRIFVELMRDPVAGNMVRTLFLNRQKAAKAGLLAPTSPLAAGDDALLPRIKAVQAKAGPLGESDRLLATALEALRAWDAGKVADPALADVAVVAAGAFPAYTGGPFNWLAQRGPSAVRDHARIAVGHEAASFSLPAGFDRYFSVHGAA